MLYINYGVPKSGSTLTFEMTYKLLELAGHKQVTLSAATRRNKAGHEHYSNSVRKWSPSVVAALEAASPPDAIVLLRTHHASSEAIAELIKRGIAKHMVGLRDPRDVALSMLDVVTRRADRGMTPKRIQQGKLEGAFRNIDVNVANSTAWAEIPGALVLDYEQTAFSHERTLDAICAQLGLPPLQHLYPQAFEAATERLEPKKNVARPYRHRREMSPEDQQMFLDRYADYYARFYPHAIVAVEEDDERELALLAERRAMQLQRVVGRRKKGSTKSETGRAERVKKRLAADGGARAVAKEDRRKARDEGRLLRKAERRADKANKTATSGEAEPTPQS